MKRFNYVNVLVVLTMLFSFVMFASPIWAAENSNIVTLKILSINDFHGALVENGKNPGAAKMAQYLKSIIAQDPNNTLLLSAGDMFQGSVDSNLLYGKTVVEVMNALNFDAMAIGNHEFDWGIDILKARVAQSTFPYLAANIIDKKTGKLADFSTPYIIIEKAGLKIGIIGIATPETAFKSNPRVVGAYDFEDPAKIVNTLVPELKQKDAEVIIVVGHLGAIQNKDGQISNDSATLAMNTRGIDAIVSGHTHTIVAGKVNNIPIVQADYFGRYVGKIELTYDKSAKQVIASNVSSILLEPAELTADSEVQSIIDRSKGEIDPIKNVVLGKTVTALNHDHENGTIESPLGQWCTDVMRQTVHADIAFENGGGLRVSIPSGSITTGLLYEVMPFDNTLYTVDLTGAQVMEVLNHGILNVQIGMLQFSGIKVKADPSKPFGQQIVSVTMLDETPLDLNKTYKVVTNDFMAAGGDKYTTFKAGKNFVDTNKPLRDVFIELIKKLQIIDFQPDDRFTTIKASAALTLPIAA